MSKVVGGKRKKEFINNVNSIDKNVILSLKDGSISDDSIQELLQIALNLNTECEKRRHVGNCKDIPNCFHGLGQAWLNMNEADDEEYALDNILKLNQTEIVRNTARDCSSQPAGFRNLGATCYMNSVLQVLFMNTQFRYNLLSIDHHLFDKSLLKQQANTDSNKDKDDNNNSNCNITNNSDSHKHVDDNENFNNSCTDKDNCITSRIDNDAEMQDDNDDRLKTNNNDNDNDNDYGNDNYNNCSIELNKSIEIIEPKAPNDTTHNFMFQLILLYYNLLYSTRKTLDPTPLVNCLQIPSDLQQDPQEFFNLFIGLLQNRIGNQIIDQLYKGTYYYVSKCQSCNNISRIPSTFYDISVKTEKMRTLGESLDDYISKEKLTFTCKYCNKLSEHERSTQFSACSLPQNFNLHLIRYVFDKETTMRKKLHDSLSFPLELDISPYLLDETGDKLETTTQMDIDSNTFSAAKKSKSKSNGNGHGNGHGNGNGNNKEKEKNNLYLHHNNCETDDESTDDDKSSKTKTDMKDHRYDNDTIYELTAILIHKGMGVTSGHYIAHIKNEITGKWWEFDDESVRELTDEQIGKDQLGEKRKQKELKEGMISSQSAYMIIYSKKNRKVFENHPKFSNQALIDEFNKEEQSFKEKSTCFNEKLQQATQQWRERKKLCSSILDKINVSESDKEYMWIHTDWLENFIKGVENGPIDNSLLLCEHVMLDPKKTALMKRVSKSFWDKIYSKQRGSPVLDQSSVCKTCLFSLFSSTKDNLDESTHKDSIIAKEKSVKNRTEGYYISSNWYKEWIKKTCNMENLKEGATQDIECEHGHLSIYEQDRKIISKETWEYIIPLNPPTAITMPTDVEPCQQCQDEYDKKNKMSNTIKKEKTKLKEFYNILKSPKYKSKFEIGEWYLISRDWSDSWLRYINDEEKSERPSKIQNMLLICEHNSLIYDMSDLTKLRADLEQQGIQQPQKPVIPFVVVQSSIWELLVDTYGVEEESTIIKLDNSVLSVPHCLQCHNNNYKQYLEKQLSYEKETVFIHSIRDDQDETDEKFYIFPSKVRRLYKRVEITPVDSTYTVEQLKLLICSINMTPTFQQKLYINNGIQLVKDSNTLVSYKITPNQVIVMKVTKDLDGFFMENESESGFKGTILLD